MKVSHIGTVLVVMVVGFAAFQNCAPPSLNTRNDSPPVKLQSLEKLEDELHSLAAADLACMTASDCQLVDVGDRPCGGADYQLLVSIKNPQYRAVLSLAEEYTHQDKIQTPTDIVGICVMPLPEVVRCVAHSCTKELQAY